MRIWTAAVVAMLVVIGAASALAQEGTEVRQSAAHGPTDVRTLSGVVSCEWQAVGRYECRRRAPQDCVRECVSVGSTYVLVTDRKMYWLSGNAPEFDQVAGGAVVVTGVVEGKKLNVLSIADEPKHRSLRFWK
jgi:hypothetical protein